MESRTRRRDFPPVVGEETWFGVTSTVQALGGYEEISDVKGNMGKENPMSLTRRRREGGQLYGDRTNIVFNGKPYATSYPPLISTPAATHGNYANRILSQTGPLTPRLHLPVAIFELRDIPRMLRHAGDLLHGLRRPSGLNPIKEAASATLAYQFGWGPLIEDIGKLLDFTESVKKRQYTLMRAHSEEGIRRRVQLDRNAETSEGSASVHSAYSTSVRLRYTQTIRYKRWATVRWIVKDTSQIGRIPTFTESMRTDLGLNRGHIPINIWKAMPWSWAIDWFADISNVMQANYNMIYYKPSAINIMTHRRSVRTYHAGSDGRTGALMTTATMAEVTQESKHRVQISPTTSISLKLPFMDGFKLSIVGSMSILALSRR